LTIATQLLEHPEETRQSYLEASAGSAGYYNTPQGFWDRLQFISVDDSLIEITDQGHVFGLSPLTAALLNAVPHVFWPDKPNLNFGNLYEHEIGGLSDEDTTTGISFSPTAEAYHMDQWVGVLVVAPLIWLVLFFAFDSLFGDLRASPWGLLVIALVSHVAPEGALNGVINLLTFGTEIFLFCAVFATWVAPVFSTIVLGPDRRRVVQGVCRSTIGWLAFHTSSRDSGGSVQQSRAVPSHQPGQESGASASSVNDAECRGARRG
jgi:hypothetical protein